MNTQLTQTVQAIALLGTIILLSGAIVMLVVQYLKDLFGLNGDKHKRIVQVIAVLVGMGWGLATMRLPASLIWPDLPATLGGLLIGLLSGMSAIGGKSFTNGAIDRAARSRAEAQKQAGTVVTTDQLQNWQDVWASGLQSLGQQIQQQQPTQPRPMPGPQPTQAAQQDTQGSLTPLDQPEAPQGSAEPDLTPVNVRPLLGRHMTPLADLDFSHLIAAAAEPAPVYDQSQTHSNLTGVPID